MNFKGEKKYHVHIHKHIDQKTTTSNRCQYYNKRMNDKKHIQINSWVIRQTLNYVKRFHVSDFTVAKWRTKTKNNQQQHYTDNWFRIKWRKIKWKGNAIIWDCCGSVKLFPSIWSIIKDRRRNSLKFSYDDFKLAKYTDYDPVHSRLFIYFFFLHWNKPAWEVYNSNSKYHLKNTFNSACVCVFFFLGFDLIFSFPFLIINTKKLIIFFFFTF